ncbi:hypothetical protein GCM10023084_42770 [Streptomyces lacrimifluminis]|uniref:Uncharacterized protein n=1 Tax=Streptomyces lacrimifluminis TaxID=1500077 RepID=A0A917NMH6_9ACTN|nr:hypothetical protein GCM10012282_05360 [Streptomyces lacrimifluminis]
MANGVLASRPGGASDPDSESRALGTGTAPEATRRAITEAVHAVYFRAAGAAALALVALPVLPPRRFPVLDSP